MLKELIEERNYLPVLKMNDGTDVTLENWEERRREMIDLLEKYCYGRTPESPTRLWGETVSSNVNSYGGKAKIDAVNIHFETSYGEFVLPFTLVVYQR